MRRICYLVAGVLLMVCSSLAFETNNGPLDRLNRSSNRRIKGNTDDGKDDKSRGKNKKNKLFPEPKFLSSTSESSKSRKIRGKDKKNKLFPEPKFKSGTSGSSKSSKSHKGLKKQKEKKKKDKKQQHVTFSPTEPPTPFPRVVEPPSRSSTSQPISTEAPSSSAPSETSEPSTAGVSPTELPSEIPSHTPESDGGMFSELPSVAPTAIPSEIPTAEPGMFTELPSAAPSQIETGDPTSMTMEPTESEQECSTALNECCSAGDCTSSEICANRNCVQKGCPQFTLTWTGSANHDLFLRTPGGASIWASEPSDPESGGAWEGGDAPVGAGGYNAENIYFPSDCSAATGIYEYFVVTGANEEQWDLEVSVNGVVQDAYSGFGPSTTFQYLHVMPPTGGGSPGESGECQVPEDECCEASDCLSGSSCAERNCVIEGALRFTLTWVGSDNKDFQVEPQGGNIISAASPIDPLSGGMLEEDVVPIEYGHYAESIYFPVGTEIVPGLYLIKVTGASEGPWTVTLSIEGEVITTFEDTVMTKSLGIEVNPPAPKCVPGVYDCCSDEDCGSSQVCAARTCVLMGNPRFTLSWFGVDDKDLVVTTPNGNDIFFDNPLDDESGGQLEADAVPNGRNFYTENVYFPLDGSAPPGVYDYLVRSPGDEPWNVTVALGKVVVDFETGIGDKFFSYQLGDIPPTEIPAPTPSPTIFTPYPTNECQASEEECCDDGQCPTENACSNRNCVEKGAPRFTLTWVGEGDKDIRVRTPDGVLIYFQNPSDPVTGGALQSDTVPVGFGYYAENVYFRGSAPFGYYQYGVSGDAGPWTLSVYVGDDLVATQEGNGASVDYSFVFGSCSPSEEECCEDSDCLPGVAAEPKLGEICVSRTCILDGILRFTLSWEGSDDKDISLTLPSGDDVNFARPLDIDSGGILEGDVQPAEPGSYVENIVFPLGSTPQLGTYQYVVRGGEDVWTVEVFVNGEAVRSTIGRGDSQVFTFELLGLG